MWALGTCLFELFTGSVLFSGRTNNDMLKIFQETLGRMSNKSIKAHLRAYHELELEPHFMPDRRFKQATADPVTGAPVVRLIEVPPLPIRDLPAILRGCKAGSDDARLVGLLTNLLSGMLQMDPLRRISVESALAHPFFGPAGPSA